MSAHDSDALTPAVSPAAASSSGPGGVATSIANASDAHLPSAALPASSGPDSLTPVGDVAPREEGRNGKNAAPIGDLSIAYDEPRHRIHAECAFDCPWADERVPTGLFFRGPQ